jgi:hypothetical protein
MRKEFEELALKARQVRVKLPSGIEFDFLLPTVGDILKFSNKTPETDDVLELIKKGLPEDLTLEELPVTDYFYLMGLINDFFGQLGKSQNGSPTSQGT